MRVFNVRERIYKNVMFPRLHVRAACHFLETIRRKSAEKQRRSFFFWSALDKIT